jgi:2-polyprenyl-3-methyl-5-hydroxy-6-metoxy-1,4-benzoquinol methylase
MDIEDYAIVHKHYWVDEIVSEELNCILKYNQFYNICDIGCGDGSLLYAMKTLGHINAANEIWGIDFSKNRLENAKLVDNRIKIIQDDAQYLNKLPSKYFDFIVSTQLIEHVSDDNKMLSAINRVAKDNAIIYIDTVFKTSLAWYFYKNKYNQWVIDPTHEREYMNSSELFEKIKLNNFDILSENKVQMYYPIIDFFIKRLRIDNRKFYINKFIKILRKIKIPIFGYYFWRIVLIKKGDV